MMTKSYVDVLIALPLERPTFTYLLEDERAWSADELVGKLALVPFGRGRTVTGLIVSVGGSTPPSLNITYKRVLHILPYTPICPAVLSTWKWAAEYYMCSPGDVLRVAIPAAFRPDGEQKYSFVDPEDFEEDDVALFAEQHSTFTLKQLRTDFPHRYIALLMQWIEEDQVYLEEEVGVGSRPGIRKGWGFSTTFLREEEEQERIREHLHRSKSALAALDRLQTLFIQSPQEVMKYSRTEPTTLTSMSELLGVGTSVINKLRTEGVIIPIEVEDKRTDKVFTAEDLPPLKEKGLPVPSFESCSIHLTNAPFSAPQDRLPISFIHSLLSEGRQVLMLFPSAEVLSLLHPILEEAIGPLLKEYHTTVPLTQRRHIWLEALRGQVGLYVGLRGTAWLPLSQLGAVIVLDEEDRGYRQFEPAPRFTASRLAMMLAHFSGGEPTELVSSAPSVESMLRAIEGRYTLSTISSANCKVSYHSENLARAFEKNKVQGRLLTFEMTEAIQDAIYDEGIALLFYQRKGFAKQLSCKHCHQSPECPSCHAIYRYYKGSNLLVCPVCGHREPLPPLCPSCGEGQLLWVGTGVERLAASIRRLYPGVPVYLDSEITPSQIKSGIVLSTAYDAPYEWLAVASMVGVVQFELLTSTSDFRANERAFQFLSKCYSSSPRLKSMVVQYLSDEMPNALKAFESKDYKLMFDHELEERHIVLFPPFARQVDIIIQSASQKSAYRFAEQLVESLRSTLQDVSVMGPTPLPPYKKDTDIGYRLSLLIPLNMPLTETRQKLQDVTSFHLSQYRGTPLYLYFDVDP